MGKYSLREKQVHPQPISRHSPQFLLKCDHHLSEMDHTYAICHFRHHNRQRKEI